MQSFLESIKKQVDLTDRESNFLVSKLKKREYKRGQYIVKNGTICNSYTYIVLGSTRTFYTDTNGNEYTITLGIEGWWVGDLESLITQNIADFNVQCLENTTTIQIYYDDLQQIYQEIPQMERFFRLLIQKAYVHTQRRIIRNYSLSALERYLLFCEEYPKIVKRVPQYMIASYLGVSKEFLSTIKSQISNNN